MIPFNALIQEVSPFTKRVVVLIAMAAFMSSGCGLSEYEEMMDSEQKRITEVDRENKLLGEPIQVNQKKGQEIEIFFRAPKGIATKPDLPFGPVLSRYPGSAVNTPPPSAPGMPFSAPPKSPSSFHEMYFGTSLNQSRDEFWSDVIQPFGAIDLSGIKKEPKTALGRPTAINYESISFSVGGTPPLSYFIFVLPGKPANVGVIFCIPQDQVTQGDVGPAMDLSLKTLRLGLEAHQRKQMLTQRSRSGPAPGGGLIPPPVRREETQNLVPPSRP